ncbi:hypothetical protein [Pectinatus frisingensis]|uniref:hypothetical protein n=1 Tax=Pectinatus frisingensis TaxID=865 RepID=UPI0018C56886|nr:hypothetical protein [Pectinatus frisingensis]
MISDEELQEWIDVIDTDRWKDLYSVLLELKQRRESDIIPATKFLNAGMYAHISKVMEECDEVSEAADDDEMDLYLEEGRTENFKHLLEELVDVQFAAETAITKILPDIQDRWALRRQVREKNAKRGYYGVGK